MATKRQKRKQAKLFAERTYKRAVAEKKITRNTEKLINNAIKKGATPDELKKIFSKEAKKAENYAKTAARTDATRIENTARLNAYNESAKLLEDFDLLVIKIWNSIIDAKTRDSHLSMYGEEQVHDDKFSNGGKHPGDPELPPNELYNCRCWITTRIEGLEHLSNKEKERLIEHLGELTDKILGE